MRGGEDLQLTTADRRYYGTEESDALLHNPTSGKQAYTTHQITCSPLKGVFNFYLLHNPMYCKYLLPVVNHAILLVTL